MRILSIDGGGYLGLATVERHFKTTLHGGGYLGLATAAFIDGVERHFKTTLHDEFELFCGTSTGAIIALAIASGMSGRDIVDMYKALGDKVFKARRDVPLYARRFPRLFRAKYALEPLQAALDSAWGTRTLGDLLASGKKVLITSYSVSAGQARIFKTDHSSQLSLHNRYRVADVALASAAAPTYFPLACVEPPSEPTSRLLVSLIKRWSLTSLQPATGLPEMFCDGGVVANHPALLGFAEAVFELKIAPRDVKVLSVSTPRTDLAAPSTGSFDRGLYG